MDINPWPYEDHVWAQETRWWPACYVAPEDLPALNHPGWLLLHGEPLSGKSVTLTKIRTMLAEEYLICEYPPEVWPKDDSENHLGRMLTVASQGVMAFLRRQPDLLKTLTPSQFEFLHWLITRFNRPRTLGPFLDSLLLEPEVDRRLRDIQAEDLYPSQTDPGDVSGQIEELVSLCRRWKLHGVAFLSDVPFGLPPSQTRQLTRLYEWLSLAQKEGFFLVAAVPNVLVQELGLYKVSRGRVRFASIGMGREKVFQAADLHVQAATEGRLQCVQALAAPELLQKVEALVEQEFGTLPVGAWVKMSQALLEAASPAGKPLSMADLPKIVPHFFRKACSLHLDPHAHRKGIWRGQRFIPLDPAQYDLALRLWQEKHGEDRAVDFEMMDISKEMMHTRIRRLRNDIEPVEKLEIYIASFRNEGYRFT